MSHYEKFQLKVVGSIIQLVGTTIKLVFLLLLYQFIYYDYRNLSTDYQHTLYQRTLQIECTTCKSVCNFIFLNCLASV